MPPLETLLARLPGVKKSGSGWSARCPAHDDRRASLSIAEGDDGTALLKCHAGCDTAAVLAALGLTLADLFPPRNGATHHGNGKAPAGGRTFPTARDAVAELERTHGKRSALWTYRNAQGEPVGVVVRWDRAEAKEIRPVASLTHADGEAFRGAMQGRGLRATTIHNRLGHARQMLEDAVRPGHVPANPWKHVRQRSGDPSERRTYVSVADAERVIEYCLNVWWKLLVALARFDGLRVPSEAFSLTWCDVDWERDRLSVPSPKTEHLGKPHRVIPLFPLLRPHLEAAFEQAAEGSLHVFPDGWRARATARTVGPVRTCGPRLPRSCGGPAWNPGRPCGIPCGHRANPTWPKPSRWPR